jgi:lipopolysaccharide/colanic/teichoic acid biosynthesis glycosyltransferase
MYQKYIKRLLDIILSFILIIILFPLMLIISLIVLVDLGLPLFNEIREREGLNKKTFIMYKFRTKKANSGTKNSSDCYTAISRILDRFRLNELPQLFNVLIGDMSLVGPRPFIPGEKLPAGDISPKRYLVRPGITGLAQVNGGRSLTHKEKLKYDVIYYDNLSFTEDFKIILKTIFNFARIDNKK